MKIDIKKLKILFFTLLIAITACESDEIERKDNLEKIGILGLWKLEMRIVDGIANMAVECCDYIEFYLDSEPDDLSGKFKAYGIGYEKDGIFQINSTNDTILFDYDNTQILYKFDVLDSSLSFYYSEDNQEIAENWRKEE